MEDSWTTVGLQRAMRELAKLMSADFERVFAASEDIKKLMQGVYNTFVEKFGFQRMNLPSLDLELHATKLKLLVAETDQFSRDPVNVANYKSFFVKKFHASHVAQARALFTDARTQGERWVQAVTLPLEVQMKDHKQLLQSRLDNLSKINEKSTGINEQLAELKAVAEALQEAARHDRPDSCSASPAARPPPRRPRSRSAPMTPPALMETTRLSVFEAPLTITRRAARAQEVFREVAHVVEEPPKPAAPKPAAPAKPAAAPDDLRRHAGGPGARRARPHDQRARPRRGQDATPAGVRPAPLQFRRLDEVRAARNPSPTAPRGRSSSTSRARRSSTCPSRGFRRPSACCRARRRRAAERRQARPGPGPGHTRMTSYCSWV